MPVNRGASGSAGDACQTSGAVPVFEETVSALYYSNDGRLRLVTEWRDGARHAYALQLDGREVFRTFVRVHADSYIAGYDIARDAPAPRPEWLYASDSPAEPEPAPEPARRSGFPRWTYTAHDGTEWVLRAANESAARAAAHCAEKTRTGSVAAAEIAARSVTRY